MLFLPKIDERIQGITFSPNSSMLAAASWSNFVVWQLPEAAELLRFPNLASGRDAPFFSMDNRHVGVSVLLGPSHVWIWDRGSDSTPKPLVIPGARESMRETIIGGTGFTPDNRQVVVLIRRATRGEWWNASGPLVLYRYDLEGQEWASPQEFTLVGDRNWNYAFQLNDSASRVAYTYAGGVAVLDLETGESAFQYEDGAVSQAMDMAFSDDGRRLAVARQRRISVYDLEEKQLLRTWLNPTKKHIQSLTFTEDGSTLLSVSNDTHVRFWDTATGQEKQTLAWKIGELTAVAVSPNGMQAAAASKKGKTVVWDLD